MVMACRLPAPRHYLSQSWLLISEGLWHSSKSNFTVSDQATILEFESEFKSYAFQIIAISPTGQ